jgi:para-nitrobenzyl esterase
MTTVTLRQGSYTGTSKEDVKIFHGIPYAQPFTKRSQLPQPPVDSNKHFPATHLGSNCPQSPSRLAFINGDWDPSTKYDDKHCAVLSVYTPETETPNLRPVIVWIHGGAFMSGGSQLSNYNGIYLAQDSNAVVVCINYRLGAFGFLHDENRSLDKGPDLPAGVADVVAAFEWVQANIQAFGGDPSNITSMGQSAGAYQTQTLLSIRPDLLHKAIIQSSPAAIANLPSDAAKVRKDFVASLPPDTSPESAPTEIFLQAQGKATAANAHLLAAWAPTTSSVPGFFDDTDQKKPEKKKKHVLIGWTATDGLAFAHIASPKTPIPELGNKSQKLTDELFCQPSITLASKLLADGHAVTTFEFNWAPKGFEFGATHCIDLPLVFGFDAWSRSPMCTEYDRKEWEVRGKRWRKALGEFVWDGKPVEAADDVKVVSSGGRL